MDLSDCQFERCEVCALRFVQFGHLRSAVCWVAICTDHTFINVFKAKSFCAICVYNWANSLFAKKSRAPRVCHTRIPQARRPTISNTVGWVAHCSFNPCLALRNTQTPSAQIPTMHTCDPVSKPCAHLPNQYIGNMDGPACLHVVGSAGMDVCVLAKA